MKPFEVWALIDGTWRWCWPMFARNRQQARRQMLALRSAPLFPRWAHGATLSVREWRAKPQRMLGAA